MSKLELSKLDLVNLKIDPDWNVNKISDEYLLKLLKYANDLGLNGKKIKEVVGIQENFSTGNKYIDFICDKVNDE